MSVHSTLYDFSTYSHYLHLRGSRPPFPRTSAYTRLYFFVLLLYPVRVDVCTDLSLVFRGEEGLFEREAS